MSASRWRPGSGSDVAMHAAGITLMRGDPLLVPAASDISRRTVSKIRQNLFWAFAYNVAGIRWRRWAIWTRCSGGAMALSSVSVVSKRAAAQALESPRPDSGLELPQLLVEVAFGVRQMIGHCTRKRSSRSPRACRGRNAAGPLPRSRGGIGVGAGCRASPRWPGPSSVGTCSSVPSASRRAAEAPARARGQASALEARIRAAVHQHIEVAGSPPAAGAGWPWGGTRAMPS